jgi:hypothetical protein
MKKTIIALATFAAIQAQASDFSVMGARYAAQGATTVANANDSFALLTNPANLVTHYEGSHSRELAVNFTHMIDNPTRENDLINYGGGYFGSTNIVFGGVYSNTPGADSLDENGAVGETGAETNQSALAFGIGNTLTDYSTLKYGFGVVMHFVDVSYQGSVSELTGSGYTYSGKVGAEHVLNFGQKSLQINTNLAAAYSTEVTPDDETTQLTLRSEIIRVGISADLIYMSSAGSVLLNLAAERLETESQFETAALYTDVGPETRFGAEWVLKNILIDNSLLSFRAGLRSFDDKERDSVLSAGLGWTSGRWSFDLSSSEDPFSEGGRIYNASASYTF